jgi:hypothetical protein
MNMSGDDKRGPQQIKVGITAATRAKYEHVKRVKHWSFVVIADKAMDALLQTDPELKRAKRQAVPA